MGSRFLLCAFPLFLAFPGILRAQPSLEAVRVVGEAPEVDGRLDEAVWHSAPAATEFRMFDPRHGAEATERTEVRILFDDHTIYVGARMFDSAPDSVIGRLFRRDDAGYSDWFLVGFDSYFNRQTAFVFGVNPRGVQQDFLLFNDIQQDDDWDAVWKAAAAVDEAGWTAEIAIPLSQLRFEEGRNVWGVNFERQVRRRGEQYVWSLWPSDNSAVVSQFGLLTGLEGIRPGAHVELLPYAVGRVSRTPVVPGDPFRERNEAFGSFGADLKYGLTTNTTLTATINPDFGQVEVDPAVVNLSAFETFFSERRPFFTEGAEMFAFGNTRTFGRAGDANVNYFYSRRIGRAPQGSVSGTYVDVPNETNIAGAAKLTGRYGRGWSGGVLTAVTPVERARFIDDEGFEHSVRVEPLTNYLVGRARKEFREGASNVGGMVTAVNRSLSPSLEPLLHESAYVGGVDFLHTWSGRQWAVSGYVAGSTVGGSAERIARTQLSSARFFQRPDADHVSFDPTRTSLSGYAGELSVARIGGTHWLGSLTAQTVSPGLETNDLGFQTLADRRALTGTLRYEERNPGPIFRNYAVELYNTNTWNTAGMRLNNLTALSVNGEFHNLWSFYAGVRARPWGNMDGLMRGGPVARQAAALFIEGDVESDPRRSLVGELDYFFFFDATGEYQYDLSLGLEVRPTPAIEVSMEPALSVSYDTDQYVTRHADPLATRTFGHRYVFGDINQVSLSVDTRIDWTFRPNLSLQFFVQPLISSVDYLAYKEFREPGTFDFDYYGVDRGKIAFDEATGLYTADPDGAGPAEPFTFGSNFGQKDFTFRSLRSNMVLRWEYRPGSTLFLVWQHLRSNEDGAHALSVGRDLDRLFDTAPDNIIQVKLTYWFGR